MVGLTEGLDVVGITEGAQVGFTVGAEEGCTVGLTEGFNVDGTTEGAQVGFSVGCAVGCILGVTVGITVGLLGVTEGTTEGVTVGTKDGLTEGGLVHTYTLGVKVAFMPKQLALHKIPDLVKFAMNILLEQRVEGTVPLIKLESTSNSCKLTKAPN